jgi:hypothetical protein
MHFVSLLYALIKKEKMKKIMAEKTIIYLFLYKMNKRKIQLCYTYRNKKQLCYFDFL